MDAFVALLLAQVPNLRYLSLGPDVARPDRLIGMVLRSAICEPMNYKLPSFEHLQDVSFLLNLGQNYVREKQSKDIAALSLFYLPNIRHMSASIENLTTFSWPKAHLPTPSQLTSLDLTKIREIYLGELLSVTPNLKSLHWKWQYDHGLDDDLNLPILDLDRIAAAISHVRGTLTELTITGCCEIKGDDQWIPSIEIKGSLNAMVNWAMLKKLQIPWAFLMGFERDKSKRLQHVMPKNIEFLSITDDLKLQDNDSTQPEWPLWIWNEYKILKKLRLWLEDRSTCTPHLRRITLTLRTEWIFAEFDEWSPDIRQAYRDLGARTGVELEIIELDTK
ncbi:hypothetical protein PENSUB_8168 [Penicillium subrubescens]|uniref:F-box domain-containing protein n=2 Tax=Penicillium subrubescens TaxID=1316194 RepID=A0A1Q5TI96_9EURO|nr:hypothetical protein PENSUB_8168 [Penicillium subrubescens]